MYIRLLKFLKISLRKICTGIFTSLLPHRSKYRCFKTPLRFFVVIHSFWRRSFRHSYTGHSKSKCGLKAPLFVTPKTWALMRNCLLVELRNSYLVISAHQFSLHAPEKHCFVKSPRKDYFKHTKCALCAGDEIKDAASSNACVA